TRMNSISNRVVRSDDVSDDDSRGRLVTGSTRRRSAADAEERPALRIQTVDDVRRAISAVDRGVFGVTPEESGRAPGGTPCDAPGDASGGVEDPAAPASMPRPATQAVLQPDPAAGLSRRAPAPEVREAGAGARAEAAEDDFS